ncbi:hypothetical protein BCR35DRAFT_334328 [Leucosporidium creatinivorum]|uniref:Uncharacterized protein n=1 Tax=Leucosporidium creatinivorum TaxID=106004 RepID=A0A1Y2ECJ4_9BASI|nr:hypothetical protein BCR35DRAFT_334328 [Leucosporidium creatinivorum]
MAWDQGWSSGSSWGPSSSCALSGNSQLHAHLLGGQVVSRSDLAPSAVLSVVFFLLLAGLLYQFWRHRYLIIIPAAIGILALALAFAIRAGIAGKHEYTPPRLATQVEQELLVISQLLLIVVHVDLSKALLHRAGMTSRPSRFAYATYVVALLCFILSTVAISRAPIPINSLWPDFKYTQLRVAAASIAFVWVLGHALWLPFEKAMLPFLPLVELGLLIVFAWFLVVPSFYAFLFTVVNKDDSPLVCSALWFYLAVGLFQFLGAVPLLVVAFINFGLNGEMDLQRALNAEAAAHWEDEHEALHAAEEELLEAQLIEEAERAHLAGEQHAVEHNAAHQGLHLDF